MSNVDKVVTPVSPQRIQDNHSGPSPVSVINIPSTTVTKVAPVVEVGDHVGVGIGIAMSYANDVDQTPKTPLKLLAEVTSKHPISILFIYPYCVLLGFVCYSFMLFN